MVDAKPIVVHCTCGTCGTKFDIISAIGPSNLCNDCAAPLFAIMGIVPTAPKPIIKQVPRDINGHDKDWNYV